MIRHDPAHRVTDDDCLGDVQCVHDAADIARDAVDGGHIAREEGARGPVDVESDAAVVFGEVGEDREEEVFGSSKTVDEYEC